MNEFINRQNDLVKQMKSASAQELYEKIIQLGKKLPSLPPEMRRDDERVPGCQSQMYLRTEMQDGLLSIQVHSDALISKGLAAMVIAIYNKLPPETILRCKCTLAQELNLESALSLSRAGGLGSILQRVQRDALLAVMKTQKPSES